MDILIAFLIEYLIVTFFVAFHLRRWGVENGYALLYSLFWIVRVAEEIADLYIVFEEQTNENNVSH